MITSETYTVKKLDPDARTNVSKGAHRYLVTVVRQGPGGSVTTTSEVRATNKLVAEYPHLKNDRACRRLAIGDSLTYE